MSQSTRRAFVTGGTGFLGRHLVEQLLQAGWSVTCLHRESSDVKVLRALGAELRPGLLHQADSVAQAMPEGVDAVFHVAANTSSWARNNDAQTRDNVEGTRAVVEASLRRKARKLVHTSTWGVWGFADTGVTEITESTPMAGGSSWINYERTKWLAEQEVRAGIARGLDAVLLNPPHIMGRYDTVNWARLIKMAHQGTLPGVPPGSGQFAHAAEVAKAHLAAVEKGRTGENYLLPGADATFLDVVALVMELAGRKGSVRVVPGPVLRLLARAKVLLAAFTGKEPDITPEAAAFVICRCTTPSTKARDELGYQKIALRPMVEESWRWLQEQGLLA
jgi:nucleoside-diphosphate-sugar epimerase